MGEEQFAGMVNSAVNDICVPFLRTHFGNAMEQVPSGMMPLSKRERLLC